MSSGGILIVEDEVLLALTTRLVLEDGGYTVIGIAVSGEEAVAEAERHRPSVVLMDIKLRGRMDGISAADEIQDRFSIPVIYLTGNTDEATLARALRMKPAGFLSKPVDDADLKQIIGETVGRKN